MKKKTHQNSQIMDSDFWPTWSCCDFSSRQGWLGFDRAHWMHIIPLPLVTVLVDTNRRIRKRESLKSLGASKWTFVQDIPFKVLHLALVHWKCVRLFLSINPWSWTSLCCSWADSLDNSPGIFLLSPLSSVPSNNWSISTRSTPSLPPTWVSSSPKLAANAQAHISDPGLCNFKNRVFFLQNRYLNSS